jgi:RimJ/RimL family protein N-acetyltransferase
MATRGPEPFHLRDGRTVTIKHCAPEDAPLLAPFYERIGKETVFTLRHPGETPAPEAEVAARWEKAAQDPDTLYLGAFDARALVAHLFFNRPLPHHPWVKHVGFFAMMVLQDYWGRGLGRRLLEIMFEHASEKGVTRIEATVRSKNERAIKLYERHGFAIEGLRRSSALIDGQYHDELFIAKLLPARTV